MYPPNRKRKISCVLRKSLLETPRQYANCYKTSLKIRLFDEFKKIKKYINIFSVREFSPEVSIFIIDVKEFWFRP